MCVVHQAWLLRSKEVPGFNHYLHNRPIQQQAPKHVEKRPLTRELRLNFVIGPFGSLVHVPGTISQEAIQATKTLPAFKKQL